ncbi:MAG: hypothetical protein L6R41_008468 [Letrouitia leprolyta]|nr:MAG: hypothetical protein L6R41_008468 [Letrouitia leprolyta]
MALESDSVPSSIARDIYGHTSTQSPTIPTDALTSIASQYTNIPDSADNNNSLNDDDNDSGILNYYFLLLALLIIILGIIYIAYARRQRQKILTSRRNGQQALARDLERWPGSGPWGPGRFRMPRSSPRQPRREEGLNERGEAPPPYVPKELEPAYTGPASDRAGLGNDIPLQDLTRPDQKPPDYDEGPSSPPRGQRTDSSGPMMRHD